jgi:hypothetical protein
MRRSTRKLTELDVEEKGSPSKKKRKVESTKPDVGTSKGGKGKGRGK